ncbi:MAG: AAA family ATPase, partial [Bacteroidetes bacterium]|nr:AAA family ATPase [Bacteroidota bacterium]
MIRKVYIKNYALIEEVSVSFSNGFTVITGETGAGKSILLSALQLALGNRLENKNLFDSTKKCIVEIEIDIPESFENWFITNDVDYAAQSIIRRELLPSGKSRLFINDSPINQGDLRLLMDQLISIHSQHEAYTLLQPSEQLRILDDFSDTLGLATEFKVLVQTYRALVDKRDKLAQSQSEEEKKWDYLSFIREELERAQV